MSFEEQEILLEEPAVTTAQFTTDPDFYNEPKDYRRELKRAQTICLDLSASAHELINNVRVGRLPDLSLVEQPVANMVKSVLRHPCAFVWVARMQVDQPYTFSHAVRCAIFATVVGRRMGLPAERLNKLALGSLLCQIGKARLPRQLLEKPDQLSAEEMNRIRSHVELGTSLLLKAGVDPEIVEIVDNHCERFNGSGYPHGKIGDQIPVLARIAGLVDCYDAMTSIKPHCDEVLSSSDALKALFRQRDVQFQRQLVEEFNHALGIYPTGSLVELTNGQVALVRRQNECSRLQPEVLVIQDENGELLDRFVSLDLKVYNRSAKKSPLKVSCALGMDEFALSPSELMKHYSRQHRLWGRFTTS